MRPFSGILIVFFSGKVKWFFWAAFPALPTTLRAPSSYGYAVRGPLAKASGPPPAKP